MNKKNLTLVAVLICGTFLLLYNLAGNKETTVFAKDTCLQPLADGQAEISFQFPECTLKEGNSLMRVPADYLESCSITDYVAFGDYIVNKSDRSSVHIQAQLPDWQRVNEGTKPEDIINVELETRKCIEGKESYTESMEYKKNWVKKMPDMKNENGEMLYAPPEQISEQITFYKVLTLTRHHKSDTYVFKRNEEELVTFRCKNNRCYTGGEPFRKNFLLVYRFDKKHLQSLSEIDHHVHQVMNSYFSQIDKNN